MSQPYPREEVIASYIYNFALNIGWQNEDAIEQFHFVIISRNTKIFEELNKLSFKKKIRNKPIKLTIENKLRSTTNVQLVYIAKDKEGETLGLFDMVEGKNILLVSDNYSNKKLVMINFYETNEHKLKFEINKANIINQGLTILPDMVLLGGTEIDVAELYRESQVSLRTMQKLLDTLQAHEFSLKAKIESGEHKIKLQDQLLILQAAAIDSQALQLTFQKQGLQNLLADIRLKQETLGRQTAIIERHKNELDEQKTEITKRENILKAQEDRIIIQDKEIQTQLKTLKQQEYKISKQQNVVYLLIVISILGIGLFVVIYKSYNNKKEANTLLTKEIEERKKIEDALGKSEDLYNNAPCGYHSLNNEGVFIGINDTELKWLGYQREEIIGKIHFTDLITDDSKKIFETNFPRFKALGEIYDLQFDIIRKDGSILPVLLSATAIKDKDGNFLKSRSNMFDITLRKKAEAEVIKLNQELEKRVKERTAQLESANKELEAFAYSVSHDLRAPLRGIDGFSGIVLDQYQDRIDEQGRNYLNRIRSATQRMSQLIDDILSLSRISLSEMNMRQVNLSRIAQNISIELRESKPERNVEFLIQDGIIVLGDERLLRIVLENLLGNAWKFTSKHKKAHIEFGVQRVENKPVCFIADDGAGFDMNYASKLFGAFQRLHDESEFTGTGIGLATVRRIIQKHGGKIWAEGAVEKGATFYFTIP